MICWEISDSFWEKVEPLIPQKARDPKKEYQRPEGAGRKPMDPRRVFEAILYVLKTGTNWNDLPKDKFGSSSSVNAYFKKWEAEGVFSRIFELGLAEADELQGVAWERAVKVSYIEKPHSADVAPLDPKATIAEKEQHFAARFERVETPYWRPVRRQRRRLGADRNVRLIYG